MDLHAAMRAFRQVVEADGFSAAGRRLGRAPSSISRQIGELEQELGVRLFNRTTRRLSLTEAGQIYYDRTGGIIDLIDEAALAVTEPGGRPTGVLRVTIPASIGREIVTLMLPDFLTAHPGVRVVLHATDEMVDIVAEGIDLAIRFGRQRDSSLRARRVATSRRVLCASPDYLKRAGTPRTPQDLADHNCLTFREHPGHNVWPLRGPSGVTQVRVTGNLFAANAAALTTAATAGLGIILLPDWNMLSELQSGRLVEVLPDYDVSPPDTPIYAVYPPTPQLAPRVRAFIDFLVERCQQDIDARANTTG